MILVLLGWVLFVVGTVVPQQYLDVKLLMLVGARWLP